MSETLKRYLGRCVHDYLAYCDPEGFSHCKTERLFGGPSVEEHVAEFERILAKLGLESWAGVTAERMRQDMNKAGTVVDTMFTQSTTV